MDEQKVYIYLCRKLYKYIYILYINIWCCNVLESSRVISETATCIRAYVRRVSRVLFNFLNTLSRRNRITHTHTHTCTQNRKNSKRIIKKPENYLGKSWIGDIANVERKRGLCHRMCKRECGKNLLRVALRILTSKAKKKIKNRGVKTKVKSVRRSKKKTNIYV